MKRIVPALIAAGALLGVAPATSLATTAPAFNFAVHVTITNNGVLLDRMFAKRGWLAHFVIENKSSQAVRFEIGGLTSKVIDPGNNGKLGAYMGDRGDFLYKIENAQKKPLKYKAGYFTVD